MSLDTKYVYGIGKFYTVHCDICYDTELDAGQDFHELSTVKWGAGWKTEKEGTEWIDICPECRKAAEE